MHTPSLDIVQHQKITPDTLVAMLRGAMAWPNPTPADLASAAYLMDWKLSFHREAAVISSLWQRDHYGLPIAPIGPLATQFLQAIEISGQPPVPHQIKHNSLVISLFLTQLSAMKSAEDLRAHFCASGPIFSTPAGASIDLALYSLAIKDQITRAKPIQKRDIVGAKIARYIGIRPKPGRY